MQSSNFDELIYLENVIAQLKDVARTTVLAQVSHQNHKFPIYSVELGSTDLSAPCLAVFGGVHGLERIGSDIAISVLENFGELSKWDRTTQERLKHSRILFVPIVNPVGMFLKRRSNGNGVDLMRNAPVDAIGKTPFLLSGQRYSNRLPWFRGHAAHLDQMELESQTMCKVMLDKVLPAKVSIAVDIHSGFGLRDQLWFPYAKSKEPYSQLAEVIAVKNLLDTSYPNHIYKIEPQCLNYTTHGDIWDFLHETNPYQNRFLPWTLELGSWTWLKKNPKQFFSSLGAFNPIQPHRFKRTLRRHLALFDFFHRCVLSPEAWTKLSAQNHRLYYEVGMKLWYEAK